MKFQIRPWHLVTLLLVVCAGTIGLVATYRSRQSTTAAELVRHLPSRGDNIVVHVDLSAIRASGLLDLLAGARTVEEEDYTTFVSETGFDYRLDLDTILASFGNPENHFLLRGRFDWEKLNIYASRRGGTCFNGFCYLPASAADRYISFFALKPDVLAVAVARGKYAASDLADLGPPKEWKPVDHPLWVMAPAARLAESPLLPSGTRSFVTAIRQSRRAILSLGLSGGRLEAALEVTCSRPEDAARIAAELQEATETLRRFIAREKKTANPRDLSGVLTSGSFQHQGSTVRGVWPIERAFLESVAGGGL